MKFLNDCKCGRPVNLKMEVVREKIWHAYIECECGIGLSFYKSSKDHLAEQHAVQAWNKKAKRRVSKKKFKTCEKCGTVPTIHTNKKLHTFLVVCENCGMYVEETHKDFTPRSLDELREIWNK